MKLCHSQLINQTQERGQTVVIHSVQWVCHPINNSSMCLFYPKHNNFRPQNYLAYACCMKLGYSEMIQSEMIQSVTQSSQKYIPSPKLITHYHTDTTLTSSLDVLRTLRCRLCMQTFGEVKLRKDRGKPVICFS